MTGDRAAGEVQWPGLAPVADDLDARRVAIDRFVADRRRQRGHRRLGVVVEQRDHSIEGQAGDLGLVALQVDDHPGSFEARGDFGHAVGAGRMIGAGHHDLAAEAATASAIRASSVATMIRCNDCDRRAASTTCRINGRPVSDKRALPGSRVEAKRAGITPTISMFLKNISREHGPIEEALIETRARTGPGTTCSYSRWSHDGTQDGVTSVVPPVRSARACSSTWSGVRAKQPARQEPRRRGTRPSWPLPHWIGWNDSARSSTGCQNRIAVPGSEAGEVPQIPACCFQRTVGSPHSGNPPEGQGRVCASNR